MKCISRILCIACAASLLLSGCGTVALEKEYDAYSYHNSFVNQENEVDSDYFAKDFCVTDATNFGLEGTYARVAEGGGVFNVSTNEVLYNQNMFKKLYPASTTKVLTAYIIIRDCDLSETVVVSQKAADQESDSSICGLEAGDTTTVLNLLYGLLYLSGNDAADALAEHHSGSIEEFAVEMTNTAHALGATNSQFKNPSGYPDREHYTTVYDMYLIFKECIKQDAFVDIVSQPDKTVKYTNKNGNKVERFYLNYNRYHMGVIETPKGFQVIGGKTGTTGAAKYCLVLYSKNPDGEDIISIVFKADCSHNLYLLMNQILRKYAK